MQSKWSNGAIGDVARYYARENFFIKFFEETDTVVIYRLEGERLKYFAKYETPGEFRMQYHAELVEKYRKEMSTK